MKVDPSKKLKHYHKYEGDGKALCDIIYMDLGLTYSTVAKKVGVVNSSVENHFQEKSLSPLVKAGYEKILGITPNSFKKGRLQQSFKPLELVSYNTYEQKFKDGELKSSKGLESAYDHFLNKYWSVLSTEIEKAEKSLLFVTYLLTSFRSTLSDTDDMNSPYHDSYTKYNIDSRRKLEQRLKERKDKGNPITYERIYQCPLSNSNAHENILREDSKCDSLDLIHRETVAHFSRIENEEIPYTSELFTIPMTPCSYIVIDDNVILTYYIEYDRQGRSRPDMLYVERVTGDPDCMATQLINTLKMKITNIRQTSDPNDILKLNKARMKEYYTILLEKLKSQMETDRENVESYKFRIKRTTEKLKFLNAEHIL